MPRFWSVRRTLCFLALSALLELIPADARAQEPLEDNSFLVEEAYNQPSRVVQHISTGEILHGSAAYSFTQEWPLGGPRYQLSYTIAAEDGDGLTFGDALLNFRWGALGGEGATLFAAPRLSAIVPLGDADRLAGNGGWGLEAALPVSWQAGKHLTLNGNLGAAWRPSAENAVGATASTLEPFVGGSAIIFVTPRFNLIAESMWGEGDVVLGDDDVEGEWGHAVTLGARYGFDVGKVQFVPGLAWMPSVDDAPTRSFLYLSIEHGF